MARPKGTKRWTVFTVEGLVGAMQQGAEYLPYNVARAYGKTVPDTRQLFEEACRAGLVERVTTFRETCYRLPKKPEADLRVRPPYPTVQFTKNLIGYDHANREFAALCMMVRR